MCEYIEKADNQDLNKMTKPRKYRFYQRTTITFPSYTINRFTNIVICLGSGKKKTQQTKNKKHPQKYPPKPILEYVAIINIFLWKLSHAL